MDASLFSSALYITHDDLPDILPSLTNLQKQNIIYYVQSTLPRIDARIQSKHLTAYIISLIDRHARNNSLLKTP